MELNVGVYGAFQPDQHVPTPIPYMKVMRWYDIPDDESFGHLAGKEVGFWEADPASLVYLSWLRVPYRWCSWRPQSSELGNW